MVTTSHIPKLASHCVVELLIVLDRFELGHLPFLAVRDVAPRKTLPHVRPIGSLDHGGNLKYRSRLFATASLIYAYVDETGNTGNRIFDPNQPLFITAAMMTRGNFDVVRKTGVAAIAKKAGVQALHANELGIGKVEDIAPDLLKLVKAAGARFFLSRLEKRYLAATKVIVTYFDCGENLAVPWQIYSLRRLRLLLTFKVARYVLSEDIAQTVWDCLTAKKEGTSIALFVEGAKALLGNAHYLPDARSQQVVTEAMQWAIDNPENFSIHTKSKAFRYSHSPNFVAFTSLVMGIDEVSKVWDSPVREIVHDRQMEMETSFRVYHEIVANASEGVVHWPGEGTPLSMRRVPGSALRMATDESSPGLQVIDVILWLFKRALTGQEIGPGGARLLKRVFSRSWESDFSFVGVGDELETQMHRVMNAPFGEDKQEFSRNFRAKTEQNRQVAMAEYAAKKAASIDP